MLCSKARHAVPRQHRIQLTHQMAMLLLAASHTVSGFQTASLAYTAEVGKHTLVAELAYKSAFPAGLLEASIQAA